MSEVNQIEAAVSSMEGLDERPLEEHVAVYEAVLETLQAQLADAQG